jgi:hypothetical protein
MAKVLKAFNTVNRRIAAGTDVSAEDDFTPHRFSDLVDFGFIEGATRPQKSVKAAPLAPAADQA